MIDLFTMLLGIMDFFDSIRVLMGGTLDLSHYLLAILIIAALLIAERYYRDD